MWLNIIAIFANIILETWKRIIVSYRITTYLNYSMSTLEESCKFQYSILDFSYKLLMHVCSVSYAAFSLGDPILYDDRHSSIPTFDATQKRKLSQVCPTRAVNEEELWTSFRKCQKITSTSRKYRDKHEFAQHEAMKNDPKTDAAPNVKAVHMGHFGWIRLNFEIV